MAALASSHDDRKIAVVTGASSGIGAASARALAADGFKVFCAARRLDRLTELADEIDGVAVVCDVTDQDQVDALAAAVGPRCDVVLNNAGGALGQDPIETADVADWERMYQINVAGTGGAGTGSGFIIREDGYILTNNHVTAGEQLVRLELVMLQYNTSFFQNGGNSDFFAAIIRKYLPLITKTLMDSLPQLSRRATPPSPNSKQP